LFIESIGSYFRFQYALEDCSAECYHIYEKGHLKNINNWQFEIFADSLALGIEEYWKDTPESTVTFNVVPVSIIRHCFVRNDTIFSKGKYDTANWTPYWTKLE